jgi:hypothetical protein
MAIQIATAYRDLNGHTLIGRMAETDRGPELCHALPLGIERAEQFVILHRQLFTGDMQAAIGHDLRQGLDELQVRDGFPRLRRFRSGVVLEFFPRDKYCAFVSD